MSNDKKVPEIRFEGFEGEWEQRKLGDLASITTGKLDANAASEFGNYAFFTCGKETLRTDTYAFDGDAILVNGNGDLGYTRKYSGKFNAYQRTYVLQDFLADYEFLEHAIHQYLPDRIKVESFGGAMPYIKANTLLDLELPITGIDEIKKVSHCLTTVDDLISLTNQKLNSLKSIKTCLLQKMFPRDGEKVPEIRFEGFTDPWEQRKLSELATMHARIGWQNLRTSEFLDDGDYMLITGTDFEDGRINFSTCHYQPWRGKTPSEILQELGRR